MADPARQAPRRSAPTAKVRARGILVVWAPGWLPLPSSPKGWLANCLSAAQLLVPLPRGRLNVRTVNMPAAHLERGPEAWAPPGVSSRPPSKGGCLIYVCVAASLYIICVASPLLLLHCQAKRFVAPRAPPWAQVQVASARASGGALLLCSRHWRFGAMPQRRTRKKTQGCPAQKVQQYARMRRPEGLKPKA